MLRWTLLIAITTFPLPAVAEEECRTYAVAFWGKEKPETLTVSARRPLADFAREEFSYVPSEYRSGPDAQRAPLTWMPRSTLAPVQAVGTVGGRRVYSVRYARLKMLLVWEQEVWSFCPVLLIDADESIVARIGEVDLFSVDLRPLVSLRVYYQGMGALQESLFLGLVDGQLTHLVQQSFGPQLERKGIEVFHRGGGFCRGSLVWQNTAWQRDDRQKQGVVRVSYVVSGVALVVDQVELVKDGPTDDCDPYYEVRPSRTRKPG
jgi:hypothetical protein